MGKNEKPKNAAEKPLMKRREFEKLVKPVHSELVAMQEWVKATGARIVVVFEGRDTAGKGGVIKSLTERASPRVFRVVALPAPTQREKSQMYIQRYVQHMPAAGEVIIFKTERLQGRIDDPRKYWKLSDLDLKSYSSWFDYSRARDAMFRSTDTAWAPWYIAHTDDKYRGRLNIITHLLDQIPYDPLERPRIKLPRRQEPGDYQDPGLPLREVPEPY